MDPFSSHTANQRIQATRFFDEESDGFAQPWESDAIFYNPPGKQVVKAWRKMTEEVDAERADNIIFVGFSVEQLCILASEKYHPTDFSLVLLRKRISFLDDNGNTGSPSHGNFICGVNVDHERFSTVFTGKGKIISGKHAITRTIAPFTAV